MHLARSCFARPVLGVIIAIGIGSQFHSACDVYVTPNLPNSPDPLNPALSLDDVELQFATIENQDLVLQVDASDSLPSGFQIVIGQPPEHGTLSDVEQTGAGATATYSPDADFVGTDSALIELHQDGVKIDEATASIIVYPEVRFDVEVLAVSPTLDIQARAFSPRDHELPEGEYQWSFGSDTISGPMTTHANSSHTFSSAGPHVVRLTLVLASLGSVQCSKGTTGDDKEATVPGDAIMAVSPGTGMESTIGSATASPLSSKTYTIANLGDAPLEWTASNTQPWITLTSPSVGTLFPGSIATVTVSVNDAANSLDEGTYEDTVTFTGGGTAVPRGITLRVLSPNCETSSTTWQNFSMITQTGVFTAEFDAIPNAAPIDGVTGLSAGTATNYTSLAAIVRFSPTGVIDARNGNAYAAATAINYTAGESYHFRMVVNVPARTYSVFVQPAGGTEVTLASNYAFRSEQSSVSNLGQWAIVGSSGSHSVCGFQLQDVQGMLSVSPSGTQSSFGEPGGPFAPSSRQYTLTNIGGTAITWTASKAKSWVTLSSTSGSLNPGASTNVTVSINSGANSLAEGVHTDTVSFTNSTNATGNTTRAVSLSVSTGGGQLATSATRHGITWSFGQPYTVGQFINGDWWVVDSGSGIVITAITRPHSTAGRDGSQINPTTANHGYDSRVGGYSATADVSRSLPITIHAGDSLVSTISWEIGESGAPNATNGIPRPALKVASVLTCLASPPSPSALRPSAYGTVKTMYDSNSIAWHLLPNLALPSNAPAITSIAAKFDKFRLDQIGTYPAIEFLHPSQAMPWYGRDSASEVGDAAMLLCSIYSEAQKFDLGIDLIQLGIDTYGAMASGTKWRPNGGHASGRKFPILFAGLMLGDNDMLNVGSTVLPSTNTFGEDAQCFYVSSATVAGQAGAIGYTSAMIGLPEWGIRHWEFTTANPDNASWGASYRTCCTANSWIGFVLAARMLGLQSAWNHDALFDYQDRYMDVTAPGGQHPGSRSWSAFQEAMWDLYRDQF